MKRKNNLYENMCNIQNIKYAYQKISQNIMSKRKKELLRDYQSIYIARTYKTLSERNYQVGKYNRFIIHDTKTREIYSQGIEDKIVNHLVTKYILYPSLLPCLSDANVASRKRMGTNKGIALANMYRRKCKIKYKNFYILKCDITKFFASINHDILKQKISRRIKDKDALKIVFDIIDSNAEGLHIGTMTSQMLALFYLNDLDHFIKEQLKVKYYVRYQDDFLLFHPSKDYLKHCLEEIKKFLAKEKLTLNSKTRIYNHKNNFIFLGRNTAGIYAKHQRIKKKTKLKYHRYQCGNVSLYGLCSTLVFYKALCKNGTLILRHH
ncbi:MAG: hypothetical protein IJ217_02095 [Clostridia bacterium]|nr:hypothetical protein [Clostridia bacterium]